MGSPAKKSLGLFQICMISIIAVDSIRTLPISAAYGAGLIFYYVLAGLLFLIPSAYISAELAASWPQTGGFYIWVRQAFGPRWGFMSAWLLWLYNLFWFPSIVLFMLSTILSLFHVSVSDHIRLIYGLMVVVFWLVTVVNFYGVRVSSRLSTLGTLVGTLLPILAIIVLAVDWLMQGHPTAISFSAASLLPKMNYHTLGLLTGVLFGLVGMEVSATFAGDVKNPQRDYPRALFISAGVILFSLILGSLAVAMVVPLAKLNLASGVMDAFIAFLSAFHLTAWIPVVALCIFIGCLGGLSTWIVGPTRCLMVAAEDGLVPAFLAKRNRHDVPVNLLVLQAVVFMILSALFCTFKTNTAYWLLSAIASQLSLIIYFFVFAAVVVLRYRYPDLKRPFKVPGGKLGLWAIAGMAWLTVLCVFIFGFFPPEQLHIQRVDWFEGLLIGSVVVSCVLGYVISRRSTRAT